MKKTLYLVRHGQTLFNQLHKIQGWCDSPLTETGIAQSKIARAYFETNHIQFTHAYSSTSERASDTLELITKLPYTRLKGLKEYFFGVFEGEREVLSPLPPFGDHFKKHGGETDQELITRVNSTLTQIMEKEDHTSVLVVSHAGASMVFYKTWEHRAQFKFTGRAHNCCIFKYEYEDGNFSLVDFINHNFDHLV